MSFSGKITKFALVAGVMAIGASAAVAQVNIKLEAYATGLNSPLAMIQPAGDDRKFVIEQTGRIKIINADGQVQWPPFLDIRNKLVQQMSDFDERGLLALAFHPDFQNNGKFYVAYSGVLNFQTDLGKMLWWDHTNVVEEYTVFADDPDVANPDSGRIISRIDWPQFNHNGHWIGFGPDDGFLYISTGDGGYANDWGIGHNVTEGNGQDMASVNGKILRVDVDNVSPGLNYAIPADNPFVGNEDVRGEIYASGLRNPWRCSFDMGDGRLFCGDVGQNSFEEIDIIEKGGNYGWRIKEGSNCFDFINPNGHPDACEDAGLIDPIIEYNNCGAKPEGCLGVSITGGYVYRGSNSDWDGKYIFGDWSRGFAAMDGQIFFATESGGEWSLEAAVVTNMEGNTPYILAFAQDADGEVYALTSITTGPNGSLDTIYKIVPAN